MVLPMVPITDRGGDAALRPCAGAGGSRRRTRQHQRGQGSKLERREKPGNARAQDQRAIGLDHIIDLFHRGPIHRGIASMRSIATLARAEIAGSITTSVVMVSREWRIA